MSQPDDRVEDDSRCDHQHVRPEHDRHRARLTPRPDGSGCVAQRLQAVGEGDLGLPAPLRLDVAVSTRQEPLPESGKRSLTLGEIGGVPVEALGELRLPLGLPPELAFPRFQLLFFPGDRTLARLELADRRLARGELLLSALDVGVPGVELGLQLTGLCANGVELSSVAVELRLARLEIGLAAIELRAASLELACAAIEVRLLSLEPSLAAGEVGLAPLLPSLDHLTLGEPSPERIEAVCALAPRLELASDSVHLRLELLFSLGELPLALRHAARGLAELALRGGEVAERLRANGPRTLDKRRVERLGRLRLRVLPPSSSHSHGSSTTAFEMGHT